MPFDKKEYNRLYNIKNKEKKKEQDRLIYLNNKEKKKEQIRLYKLNNEEKIKIYKQSEQGKKTHRISNWKRYGIICFNFDLLYDLFVSTDKCEFCDIKLTIDKITTSTTKCLDHDHNITDKFNIRGVLCWSCNIKDVLK